MQRKRRFDINSPTEAEPPDKEHSPRGEEIRDDTRSSLYPSEQTVPPLPNLSHDQSQAERSNSIVMAGAVMGAVLVLFLIAVFVIVILTARKAPPPSFTDKV
ncbi:hypothetical protein EYF80_000961 [Liparis tanakae]|uniref:Uncharacterized protein n=1 Tax=Liparis tanakae TaxID=230148 RepID=A0A4Z2JEE7_9TELE|nr:hypothetical protein EYF80_000961 [Liparis tanakae]